MLSASISRNSLKLALFAALTTAVIAGTQLSTQSTIAENRRMAEERALLEVIPKSRHDNSMLDDTLPINDSLLLGLREEKSLYVARQSGQPVAIIFPVTARDGYTDDIDLIVGINMDGTIAGVRVLTHRETPGLGDKIERKKSDWIESFRNRSLQNPTPELWKVKKDKGVFDQFTGATITPRAVTRSVRQALEYFDKHRDEILQQIETAAAANEVTDHG